MARYTVNRLTKQADWNARIERLTSEGIETVKVMKSWEAMGISDDIIVTACKPLILCGARRAES